MGCNSTELWLIDWDYEHKFNDILLQKFPVHCMNILGTHPALVMHKRRRKVYNMINEEEE